MRLSLLCILLAVGALELATAEDGSLRFKYDSEHRYREFYQGMLLLPPPDYSSYVEPRLLVRPKEILKADMQKMSSEQAQIFMVFNADSSESIRSFIDSNRARNMRLEIGDYVLPVDIERTFPWTGTVWLEPRPLPKAKVILGSFKDKNKS